MDLLFRAGYGIVRSAGSGVSKYPCPDLIAGKDGRVLAIECKASSQEYVYIKSEQMTNLIKFSKTFGAEPWIGIRFNNQEWVFLKPSRLKRTASGNYKVTRQLVSRSGKLFSELI